MLNGGLRALPKFTRHRLVTECNKCINADFLIRALENGETINNYSNMRDFLRQMTKPSEVALKQEFAEELIKGQWYITAECNEEKKKYQLMPRG